MKVTEVYHKSLVRDYNSKQKNHNLSFENDSRQYYCKPRQFLKALHRLNGDGNFFDNTPMPLSSTL